MPSFDIVSELNEQEVVNAVQMVQRDVQNRFDFKGSKADIEFDKKNNKISIKAEDELKMRALEDMTEKRLLQRGIDGEAFRFGPVKEIGGTMLAKTAELVAGIDKEKAKEISKHIRSLAVKVQPQIQDEQLRVTGKKIDDLQEVIEELKKETFGIPLQYINFRK